MCRVRVGVRVMVKFRVRAESRFRIGLRVRVGFRVRVGLRVRALRKNKRHKFGYALVKDVHLCPDPPRLTLDTFLQRI